MDKTFRAISFTGFVVLTWALFLVPMQPASAQIVPCSGMSDSGYKILVDDIVAGSTTSPLMPLLIGKIDSNIEQVLLETGFKILVLRCAKRRPMSVGDFRQSLISELNARQVLLEVWGTVAIAGGRSQQKVHEAVIGYALVPVGFYSDSGVPRGTFMVPRQAKSLDSADDLVRLVDQAGSLAAYAALAAGTRLLNNDEYDKARNQLCKAQTLLEGIAPQTGNPDDASLLQYARRLAQDTIAAARADNSYHGPLKALPASILGSCAAGGK